MRFALALVTLLLAGVLVATGFAERTVLKPADHVTVAAKVGGDARYVVIPGSVLRAHPGQQRLHLSGSGTAFAAYGRSGDVAAWLAGERYTELRVDATGHPMRPAVKVAPAVAGLTGAGSPDPDGSDLWLDQRTGRRSLDWSVDVPRTVSLLVAADGTGPAPSSVRVTWPVTSATPLAVPLIVVGGVLAVVGLLLYVWALVHVRRRRGPRRTPPPKMPKPPQPPRYRPAKPAIAAQPRGRRRVRRGAMHRVLPIAAVLALAAGLTTAVPARPAAAAAAAPAAVTEEQAERIVHDVAEVAAAADAKRDVHLLATRFDGPALALRKAAYRIRRKDRHAELPQALPTRGTTLRPILPQATSGWPRTLFAVLAVPHSTTTPPIALTLVQDDPWADYHLRYAIPLRPKAALPDLPAATTGASRLDAAAPVLRVAPDEVAADYGLLLRDPEAPGARLFASVSDGLADRVGAKAKRVAAKRLGDTAKISFEDLTGDPQAAVAMSTANAGALVSVDLEEQWTVKPKRAGVTIRPSGGTRILSKTDATSKGIASVYGYQLLFSVPSAGSDEPVVLLGYAQGLVSAKEL